MNTHSKGETFGVIIILALLVAGVSKLFRNYYDTANKIPDLDAQLKMAWLLVIPIVGMDYFLPFHFFRHNFFNIVIVFALYLLYRFRNISSTRLLIVALLPFAVGDFLSDFIELVSPNFQHNHDNTFSTIVSITGFWLLGFGIYAFRQNKQDKIKFKIEEDKRKALEAQRDSLENQVAERTAELTKQKDELELALKELKATQNQLIQSEKLASLGELTAGIAHEIQNPLNFVNNFAELSVDLAKDINFEIHKQDMDKVYLEELLTDLKHNQEKINLHGKRASSIVKGMLEHSRSSSGVKEWADINKLCDEYFRLAYHGLRAKDKEFNCELISQFDETLPKIEIIPQDVGRVILNLINNAFYAVNERKKWEGSNNDTQGSFLNPPTRTSYAPTVTVSTHKFENAIEIRVIDNGTGMSENVIEKIFQPFFTTKPTGSGTGLGLSLAYDIITKGHSGTLKVGSTPDVGSEFVVTLPILN